MKTIGKNLVQLTGNLGNDVQLTEFDNGNKKASFSLAVNNAYTSASGESKKETSWFNIVGWGSTANDMSVKLKKGIEIGVEGRITNRRYVDKAGNTKYITEIVASQFVLVERTEKDALAVIS